MVLQISPGKHKIYDLRSSQCVEFFKVRVLLAGKLDSVPYEWLERNVVLFGQKRKRNISPSKFAITDGKIHFSGTNAHVGYLIFLLRDSSVVIKHWVRVINLNRSWLFGALIYLDSKRLPCHFCNCECTQLPNSMILVTCCEKVCVRCLVSTSYTVF